MQKVMVFGVFDGLHDGHREFLRHARGHGDYLIAVVTPDHIVHELKGRVPDEHEGDRIEKLWLEGLADRVVVGDSDLGTWQVVR
jgi:cytidyltransferase-like protein